MPGDAKAEWVKRVLGVIVATAPPDGGPAATFDEVAFKRSFRAALATWRDASESVEAQLNDIRKALLDTDDDELHRIAEYGLNGITDRRKVGLHAALLELGQAAGAAVPPLAKKAAQAAVEYQLFVRSDARVTACDLYPDIKTPIGPTLGEALGKLAQALAV